MSTTPLTNGRMDKSSKKQTKIVVLSIQPSLLKRFKQKKDFKDTPSIASSPAPQVEEMPPKTKTNTVQEKTPESMATPLPPQNAPSPGAAKDSKPPSVNGVKRATPLPDGLAKPRGKPGPKKKPRLEDGTIDHSASKPAATATANHKLGPKANTGFINANLRALDRSGTPCRRWAKKGFHVRSFTGHTWELPGWKGSASSAMVDGTSDSSNKDVSMPDSSDQKPSESAGSNAGDQHDKMEISTPAASSPPPMLPPRSTSIQA